MLFLTTVKFFLSSISFKALIVVNNFRNVRGWAPNRSREPGNENPAKSPQALCQRLAPRRAAILLGTRGSLAEKQTWIFSNRKFYVVHGKYCSVPYYAYTFRSLKVNRIGFSVLWFENKKPSYDSQLEKNIPAQASTQAAQASRH